MDWNIIIASRADAAVVAMLITAISDLHGHYPKLEGGDLLIVAGDLTATDGWQEVSAFKRWLYEQDYAMKIVVAGNHDNALAREGGGPWYFSGYKTTTREQISYATYLCDSGCEFEGLKIWGSPWTSSFEGMNPHCKAFCLDTEEELAEKWDLIPTGIDILATHSPPKYILDATVNGKNVGSSSLYDQIELRIRPKLHVFGHIHEAYGQMHIYDPTTQTCRIYCNASHVNERYQPVNSPIRVIM